MRALRMLRSIPRLLKSIAPTSNQLQVAWSYPTGDGNKYLFNPIVVDRTMYVLAHNNSIVALDATTGQRTVDPSHGPEDTLITNRGINYWESADRSDRRLLFAADNFLQEIDARTGQSIVDFGKRWPRRFARRAWDAIRKA